MYDVLAGIKVVEVAMWAFVPSAAAVLADWGADVVKVVHPEYGDPMRGAPVGDLPRDKPVSVSFMWEILNRGKKCVSFDLANPKIRPVFEALVRDADVFLTNFLPDARTKLRIDVDDIRTINPAIVYGRGTGHGPNGPESSKGGYDHTSYWARTGMAHAAAMSVGEFVPQPGAAMGDLMSGFALASGITGALLRRERTGQTAVVDVSLLGTGAYAFSPAVVASKLYDVPTIPRRSHRDQPNPMVAGYMTRDGRIIYFAGMLTEVGWSEFCHALGHPEMADDPRFREGTARLANRVECIEALDAVFAERDLAEWIDRLRPTSIVWSVVQSANEVHTDPQTVANGYIVDVEAMDGTSFPLVGSPVQFDGAATPLERAPDHGEHTDQVLLDLGLSWDDIIDLKASGAVE